MTIYLDSLYLTIVQKSKFLTNHNAAQQTRFMSLDETFAEGLSFVCMIVRRCIVRTLDGISHINVGFLLGFAPAARRREPAAGGSSAGGCTNPASVPSTGDGTSTSIGGQAMHYSCFKSLALCEDLLFNGPNAHESRFRLQPGLRMWRFQNRKS